VIHERALLDEEKTQSEKYEDQDDSRLFPEFPFPEESPDQMDGHVEDDEEVDEFHH
jgi:hypothetical protein